MTPDYERGYAAQAELEKMAEFRRVLVNTVRASLIACYGHVPAKDREECLSVINDALRDFFYDERCKFEDTVQANGDTSAPIHGGNPL